MKQPKVFSGSFLFVFKVLKLTHFFKTLPLSTFKYSFHALKNVSKENFFLVFLRRFLEQSYSQAWGCRELHVNVLSLSLGVFLH